MSKKKISLLSAFCLLLSGSSAIHAQQASAPTAAPPARATQPAPAATSVAPSTNIKAPAAPVIALAPAAALAPVAALAPAASTLAALAPVAAPAPGAMTTVSSSPAVAGLVAPRATSAPAQEGAPAASLFFQEGNFLGVYVEEVTKENLSRTGLSAARGVLVTRVIKDSPAERAGLRENDVILRFDGEAVTSVRKMNRLVEESAPEHNVRLTISRGGAEQEINVTLGSRRGASGLYRMEDALPREQAEQLARRGEELRGQSEQMRNQGELMRSQREELRRQGEQMRKQLEEMKRNQKGLFSMKFASRRRIGISTTRLTDQLADYFGVERGRGLLVTSVSENSPAAKAGIKAGDIITQVEGERVAETADLTRAINRREEGDVTLGVVRDRKARTVRLTPERTESAPFELYMDDFALPSVAVALPRITIPQVRIATPRVTVSPVLIPTLEINLPRITIPRRPLRPIVDGKGTML